MSNLHLVPSHCCFRATYSEPPSYIQAMAQRLKSIWNFPCGCPVTGQSPGQLLCSAENPTITLFLMHFAIAPNCRAGFYGVYVLTHGVPCCCNHTKAVLLQPALQSAVVSRGHSTNHPTNVITDTPTKVDT